MASGFFIAQTIENALKLKKNEYLIVSLRIDNCSKVFTPVKSRFRLANMRFSLLYVSLVAEHENTGLFREIFSEHPWICKSYPQKGVFLMYSQFECLDLAKNWSIRVFWVVDQEFGAIFYK